MWKNFDQQIITNLFSENRFSLYVNGFLITILLTLGAAAIGIIIGSLTAIIKIYARANIRNQYKSPFYRFIWKTLNFLCDLYTTVIRGTPMTMQLLIFAFVIFSALPMNAMFYVAMLAFGINSGAYVSEVIRAGILSINVGQTEAGRSLGLNNNQTMWKIIFPQALRNILPALGNEAITLLKETSIASFIAVADMTYAASLIRSRTYSAVPLLFVALIYLGVVTLLTWILQRVERRLDTNDRR